MGGNKMITDEQIRESEWQNGVYQLKKGCQDLLDEIESKLAIENNINDLKKLLNVINIQKR